MKRRAAIVCALALGIHGLGVTPALAQPAYELQRFDADIELREDASMTVTERIEVVFHEPRRGIIRSIPVEYDTGSGTTRRLRLDVDRVTDAQGRPLTTSVSREGHNVTIRIGDEDVYLEAGTTLTYVITYTAKGMLNWFEAGGGSEVAELYWNVTGDRWDTVIRSSSATVRYPQVAGAEGIRLRVFAGPYGDVAHDDAAGLTEEFLGDETGAALAVDEDHALVRHEGLLDAYEGLTFVLAIPASHIPPPSAAEKLLENVLSNLGFSTVIWVVAGMLGAWWLKGRDVRSGPVVVQYEPPDGISGPEAGALIDERVHQRDVAAGMISLAVKGYVELFPGETGAVFKRRTTDLQLTDKPPGPDLTSFEKELLTRLQGAGDRITGDDLREKVAPHAGALNTALYDSLVSHGYYPASPETSRWIWLGIGVLAIVALGFVFTAISPFKSPLPSIVGGLLALPAVIIVSRAMPRRTHKGAEAHRAVLGFEEFVRRAKTKELQWQTKVEPTQALFERVLPHAIAFGLVREWAEAFAPILTAPPTWYHGPPGTFHAGTFGSDLSTVADTVGSAATTPPRSAGGVGGHSGFGGGGFSGGGFGGGGGGSW
jgi:uncharacterized protein (TIGR04222 family)